MAGWVIWKGSVSSLTVAAPAARRARMARRVGSARAANVASRRADSIAIMLYNHLVIHMPWDVKGLPLVWIGRKLTVPTRDENRHATHRHSSPDGGLGGRAWKSSRSTPTMGLRLVKRVVNQDDVERLSPVLRRWRKPTPEPT